MMLGIAGLGVFVNPPANLFGSVLAAFYSFSHNYGIAIVLLTLAVMLVVFPLTRRGTRSMMKMQLLQPELMKIRNRYKSSPGQSAEDKQANRADLNEEMMALYKENGVSPTGGCLPMFLQFPIFYILYDVIRGMTTTKLVGTGVHKVLEASPQYVPHSSSLYHSLIRDHGQMHAFGLNLADSVRTHQNSWVDVVPYVVVILIAVAFQYISMWQITNRNPAASQAPSQMQAAQKFMPLIFVFFYIVLPAGVGLYFIVSSAFRVVQQEWMYKHDPDITASLVQLRERKEAEAKAGVTPGARPKGFRERLRELASQSSTGMEPSPGAVRPPSSSRRGSTPPKKSAPPREQPSSRNGQGGARTPARSGTGSSPSRSTKSNGARRPSQSAAKTPSGNRSQNKRPRRPR